jgi:transcription termination factor Rho
LTPQNEVGILPRSFPGGAEEQSLETSINIADLETRTREDLQEMARGLGISSVTTSTKQDLIHRLVQAQSERQGTIITGGVLEITDEGYGFLRRRDLRPAISDVYVSQSQVRRFALRMGDLVTGQARPPKEGERYHGLLRVETVDGLDPEAAKARPYFEQLTPTFPDRMFDLETTGDNFTTRLINLVAPIGRGQRGLIVSPPKAGKTTILKQIANAVTTNYEDVTIMVLLIGERPEEVTDMRRTVKGEVIASTFDEPMEDHIRVAELALERAKRQVEAGHDVLILLDGITRLTRSYNLGLPPSGRTLSGGIDTVALYPPKRFFGAARNSAEGGSLTIIATCLVDTGSRMDEVIYEEFKGTGNWELQLDRRLAERRFFPAIDILRSGTRREELLLDEQTLRQIWLLRRMVAMIGSNAANPTEATERVIERMSRTANNSEFLATLHREV